MPVVYKMCAPIKVNLARKADVWDGFAPAWRGTVQAAVALVMIASQPYAGSTGVYELARKIPRSNDRIHW